jgi:hypothetical protein
MNIIRNDERLSTLLTEISAELRPLSRATNSESHKYLNIVGTFKHVNELYRLRVNVDIELIAMQSGLHENTVRKLFRDEDAFMSAKLSTIVSFLDTLGISLWAR